MELIEQQAVETYGKNIEYFQKEHPKLVEMLQVLDMALTKF